MKVARGASRLDLQRQRQRRWQRPRQRWRLHALRLVSRPCRTLNQSGRAAQTWIAGQARNDKCPLSSKYGRATAERQARRGGRTNGILKNKRYRDDGGGATGRLGLRWQGHAGRAAKIAVAAGRRGIVAARLASAVCTAQAAKLPGAHVVSQQGHRRNQRGEHGQTSQPRRKAGPERAGGQERRHRLIIGRGLAAQNATKSGATHARWLWAGGQFDS